ncbi:MAG: YhdH/YhfP family quinone oxidoreductase [Planctomycetaceae bacterium]|nr:YhdH/YhfP family quinone oxidoreductase [Planctomycetaceae bacterium]
MTPAEFRCYLVNRDAEKRVTAEVTTLPLDRLPAGDVLIRVQCSSLNFKDALAASGRPGVAKTYPHVPGIDAAGVVAESRSPQLQVGQEVIVTGYDLGAGVWGGYSEYIRVPAGWVVPLPQGLSLPESMIYGTAGLTAAMSLEALIEQGITPDRGEIVVTGATGGVGSVAVALLAKAGYRVAAVTGKPDAADYLTQLGATTILDREAVNDTSGKPLLAARWAGAVDTVGGNTLATIIRSTERLGCVTASGLVGGIELPLTVMPFILRGVKLVGIDSAEYPLARRIALWNKMAKEWRPEKLELMLTRVVGLSQLAEPIREILAGKIRGRVVVKVES